MDLTAIASVVRVVGLVPFMCLASLLAVEPNAPMGTADLAPARAIVVLGGDSERRARHAAELYAEGLAPRVLVTGRGIAFEK